MNDETGRLADVRFDALTGNEALELRKEYREALLKISDFSLENFAGVIDRLPQLVQWEDSQERGGKDALEILSKMHDCIETMTNLFECQHVEFPNENKDFQVRQEALFESVIASFAKNGIQVPDKMLEYIVQKEMDFYSDSPELKISLDQYGDDYISAKATQKAGNVLNQWMKILLENDESESALKLAETTIEHYSKSKVFNHDYAGRSTKDWDDPYAWTCTSARNPLKEKMPFLKETFEIFRDHASRDTQRKLIESVRLLPTSAISEAMVVAHEMMSFKPQPALKETPKGLAGKLKEILSFSKE